MESIGVLRSSVPARHCARIGLVAMACACSSPTVATTERPTEPTGDQTRETQSTNQARPDDEAAHASVANCVGMNDVASDVSPETLADDWAVRHEVDELVLTLPKEPDTLELPEGPGRVVLSDEFGDAFGVLDGPPEHLSFAFGRALDRLYGVEWGEAEDPDVSPGSSQASFEGFGQDYVACWQSHGAVWLFAVVPVARQPLAKAFVEGASVE